MRRAVRVMVKVAAVAGLVALTLGAGANPDPGRTGAANDGGTSGPGSGSGSSGSGCGK